MLQRNPVNGLWNWCALTAKEIEYWSWIPTVLGYESGQDYQRCPFAGGAYQWMRNVVCAAAWAAAEPKRQGVAAVVYPEGPFPIAGKLERRPWTELVERAGRSTTKLMAISYQRLLAEAVAACADADRPVLEALLNWGGGSPTMPACCLGVRSPRDGAPQRQARLENDRRD
jgi:ribosomal protein L25 (general stress protein Ctc)